MAQSCGFPGGAAAGFSVWAASGAKRAVGGGVGVGMVSLGSAMLAGIGLWGGVGMKWLWLIAIRLVFTAVHVGLGLLAWQLFRFIGAPWLILLWPLAAAVSDNRSRSVEVIAIWHGLVASYVSWGLLTGFWYPPTRYVVALFNGPAWLPWAGWGLWAVSVVLGLLAALPMDRDRRFDAYTLTAPAGVLCAGFFRSVDDRLRRALGAGAVDRHHVRPYAGRRDFRG